MIKEITELVERTSQDLSIKKVTIDDFVFEKRVLLNCFYCPKYGVKWTCPPRIPNLDYREVFVEYENFLAVFYKKRFTGITPTAKHREESSNLLHKTLLEIEKVLWQKDHPLAVTFIGGCCKLCKDECSIEKCKQPSLARIPLEACGINVVKTMRKVGIEIVFPPKVFFYRVGMLVW